MFRGKKKHLQEGLISWLWHTESNALEYSMNMMKACWSAAITFFNSTCRHTSMPLFRFPFYMLLVSQAPQPYISLQVFFWFLKGTNGRQKIYEMFHVYCIFYSGFMCQTTVIFGITKDGSLVLNTLASWNCFTCRNLFQNGANDMSECLTCETTFCKKAQIFV